MIGLTPINLGQATRFAWSAFKKRFGLFTAILLTMVVAWVVLETLVVEGHVLGIVWWAAAHAAFLVFFAGLELGLLRICLDTFDGGEPRFAEVFGQMRRGPTFLIGQVLFLLFVLLGLVLFVIPGAYLAARYGLFGFCMADARPSLSKSLQACAALGARVKMRLFAVMAGSPSSMPSEQRWWASASS